MPLPQWPASVPQGPFMGYTCADDPSVVAFEVDAGPVKVRPRGTLARRRQSTPYECNGTEKAIIDTFYRSTLLNGTQAFEWTDFQTGAVAVVRLDMPRGIQWDNVTPGRDPAVRRYRATLAMEIIPS